MFLRRFSTFLPPLKALENLNQKSEADLIRKILVAAINDGHSHDTIMRLAGNKENIEPALNQIAAGTKNPAIERFLNARDAHDRYARTQDFATLARISNRND